MKIANKTPKWLSVSVRVLLMLGLVALFIYLFPRYDYSFHRHIEIGKPWGYDLVTAESDFPIYKTDKQLARERAEILADFAPYYQYTASADGHTYILSADEKAELQQEGYSKISILVDRAYKVYPLSKIETPKGIYLHSHLDVTPNLVYDSVLTEKMKAECLSELSLTQGMVQKGEKIVDRGEVVTEEIYQKLYSLQKAQEASSISLSQKVWHTLGETLLVCIFILLFVLYLYIFRPSYLTQLSTLLFFAVLATLIVVPSCLLLNHTQWSLYLIPFAWVPVLTRVFFDARTALFLHWIVVLIVSLIVPAPFEFIITQVTIGMVAVVSLKDMTQRAQLTQTAGWIFAAYAFTYAAVTLAMTGDIQAIDWRNYIYFAINAVFIIFAYGIIYIFERVFRLMSSITLVELADLNSELMRTMAEKAPGTFQHAVQVSSLATEAAKRVNANALLVRTAALYHDIGKIVHPECFIENQQDGINPLSSMSPQQAAAMIISHVTEGEKLARKHHLPETVIHFITSHHGTSLVRYFYNTAVNNGEAVSPKDFQYPGPKPSTREAAILMMADAVEARSRSIKDFTEQNINEAVDQMIDMQIEDGQLNETPLSFQDVEAIRRLFKERLISMHHHRISYPTIKK